jgi:hypothetical protein
MDDDIHYLLYRVFSQKERPTLSDGNNYFYGWTNSKKIVKAFFKQRDKNKYVVFESTLDEIASRYSENDLRLEKKISFLKLKSAKTGEEFSIFMTSSEMCEAEKRIQRMAERHCYFLNIDEKKGILHYIVLFINLKEKYQEALNYIGYRPPEMQSMFDSVREERAEIEECIDLAYGESLNPREYYHDPQENVPGLSTLSDVSKMILYSVESFVKVLKDDM